MTGLADVRAQAMAFLPYAVALPAVSVWAFLYDGMFFGATRTAELRNGMVVALALFGLLAWLLVPAYGNHGLWLAFLALPRRARRDPGRHLPARRRRRRVRAGLTGENRLPQVAEVGRHAKKSSPAPSCDTEGYSQIGSPCRCCRDPAGYGRHLAPPGLRTGVRHSCSHGGLVMRSLDLTPLFRSTVGFDHLDKLFETAFREAGRDVSYPPYNIAKIGQDKYRISMAVAGFGEGDLDITAQGGVLTVKGQIIEPENGVEYLHRGIAQRSFEHRFQLADHVKVVGANLRNGLLDVELAREVPEAMKPRKIEIGGSAGAAARDRGYGCTQGGLTRSVGPAVRAAERSAGMRRRGGASPLFCVAPATAACSPAPRRAISLPP